MNSIFYLIVRTLKNRLLGILRSPVKLIMYLVIIVFFIGFIIMTAMVETELENQSDIFWLKAFIFGFILFFAVLSLVKGLKSGDVIYEMSDVNFLFVSPIDSRKILVYGAVRMIGMALLTGIFILFQGGTLAIFGIPISGLVWLFVGYILAAILLQILSLIIYSLTNGRPKRKMTVRIIAIGVFVPMLCYFAYQFSQNGGDILLAFENLMHSQVTAWTPVTGWAMAGTIAFMTGDVLTGGIFLGLLVVTAVLLVVYLISSKPDFYEDVLVATETLFEKKRAIAEGNLESAIMSDKKVKVVKTGIGGSGGASAIFHKHLRESFRASRMGIFGGSTIAMILLATITALVVWLLNDGTGFLVAVLGVMMWMQVLLIGSGRGLKELFFHYVYMIPESSFTKIIWSNIEVVFRVLIESVVIFSITGLVLGESILVILACMLVYTLFSMLLLGLNYAMVRVVGSNVSVGLLLFYYFAAIVIILLPGLIPAIVVAILVEGIGLFLGLLILAIWELAAALACFAIAQGILHRMDIQILKTL